MGNEQIKNLLHIILTGITDNDIEIKISETEKMILAEVKPNNIVLKRYIIGKEGKTINSIRRIFDTISYRVNKKIIIEVV